jgi:hypothetical protein
MGRSLLCTQSGVRWDSVLTGSMQAFSGRDCSLPPQILVKLGERHSGALKVKCGVVQCLGHAWRVNGVEPRQTCDENG